jgi:C4-dicarboxylate-specific signal transduction histidine kinase
MNAESDPVRTQLEERRLRELRHALQEERCLRKSADDARLRANTELAAMMQLHQLSTRLLTQAELSPLLEEVLDAAISLMNADFGNVQLYDDTTGALKIVAQRGFTHEFLDYFASVREGSSACGVAMQRRERVIVEDVLEDGTFTSCLNIAAAAGFRAVTCTPLCGSSGDILGMLSTHFRRPHRPTRAELQLLDLYASQAAQLIEHKQAQKALTDARVELARMMRVMMMGELVASIAHEIKQPLAAVVANASACAHWLDQCPPDIDEATEAVARIIRDANRASESIVRIRTLLQRGVVQKSAVDINEVIAEVAATVQSEIRDRGVSLCRVRDTTLPLVAADRVQLQQVVLNLVMNALDALNPVTQRARVLRIDVSRHGTHALQVSVRDSGVGLRPEHREQAFSAFHTTKPTGLGMGLAISRSIVEAHGGRLWATPNDNYGETFHFTLPFADLPDTPPA